MPESLFHDDPTIVLAIFAMDCWKIPWTIQLISGRTDPSVRVLECVHLSSVPSSWYVVVGVSKERHRSRMIIQ